MPQIGGVTRSPYDPRRARAPAARLASAVAVAAAGLALGACDPCAGVASCTEPPRLGVSGQIVDRGNPTLLGRTSISGADIAQAPPVAGVRVQVFRTAGTALNVPQAEAMTDASGWWQVDMPAASVGGVTVAVVVTPPGSPSYRVDGLNLLTDDVRGRGNVLGRWTRALYLTLVGQVYDEATGTPVDGARVTATRRSGIQVAPTPNTGLLMTTFDGGRFLYDVRPLADGPLVLDFVVERSGLPTAHVDSVTVYPQHEWLPPDVDGELVFRLDSAGRRVLPPATERTARSHAPR